VVHALDALPLLPFTEPVNPPSAWDFTLKGIFNPLAVSVISIEKQGRVLIARNPACKPPAPPPGKRGDVNLEMSKKSRRRLFILLNRLETDKARMSFLTLTFHYNHTPEEYKAAFKRFRSKMLYWFPEMSALWRVELQKRGTAHYHMLCFNLPFIPWYWIVEVWTDCTREDMSGINIQLIENFRHASAYVSKYIGKMDEDSGQAVPLLGTEPYQQKPLWAGRHWGIWNGDALPYAPIEFAVFVDDDLAGYLWFAVRSLSRGKCANSPYMAMLFCDDADKIWEWIRRHAALWSALPVALENVVELSEGTA